MSDPADLRLRRMLDMHALLFDVASEIGPGYDLEGVLRQVLMAMRRLIDFRGGSIALIEGDVLRLAATDPEVSPEVMAARLPLGQGLAGRAAATGEAVVSGNLDEDPRVVPELRRLGSNAGIVSYLAVPLVCLGEVTGVLQVDSGEVDAFDADDLTVLQGLGVLVAGSIESARRNDAVAELERLRLDFLNRTAHELRTPVTILEGFAELARNRNGGLEPEEALERIETTVARLRHLVEETLDVVGLEAGTRRPVIGRLDLREAVQAAIDGLPHEVDVTIDESVGVEVNTDAAAVGKILRILLDNVAKYARRATVHARQDGPTTTLVVDDEGPGIPEKLRPKLFERFSRGGDHGVGGLGLGLALARQLAATLEASLAYEPLPDGSRFTLTLRDRRLGLAP